jgi:3',5'-nucleoside bisphosphate phosphatase
MRIRLFIYLVIFWKGRWRNYRIGWIFLKRGRGDRNKKIIHRLRDLGFSVSDEELQKVAGQGTVGRPHIARLLLEKRYVQSMKEAFDRFLSATGLAYYPKEEIPLREGIDLLHDAGCVTSVAHPLLLQRSAEELELSFKKWREWGLDALEGVYPTYKPEQVSFVQRIAQKYGFLITGGSDFHGDNKPHIKIGVGTGTLHVPDELIEPLLERKNDYIQH